MELVLHKKPQKVRIVQGFPGFGLVGSIAAEFLNEHLRTEYIGHIWLEDLSPSIAIHRGERINPISLYYSEEYNIVLIHGITSAKGSEWKIARAVQQAVYELQATELICLEGIGSTAEKGPEDDSKVLVYSSDSDRKEKLLECGCEALNEGIVLGINAATLIRTKGVPLVALFGKAYSDLPDSKAAAKIIEVLDRYLGLSVDYKPLLQQAEEFEKKLRGFLSQAAEAEEEHKRRQESYIG